MPVRFTDHIASLPATIPFVGPETAERQRGKQFLARIGANESVFGPSPRAIAAMAASLGEIWKYCDPENHDLRAGIAKHYGISPDNVVIGEGIDGLLGLGVRLFVEQGVSVVMPDGAYPTFAFHVNGFAGNLVKVPLVDDRESIDDMLEAARRYKARILYLSNPNNPMGTFWEAGDLRRLADNLPDGCVLFLDEAYCEFAPEGSLLPVDVSEAKVIRFRTFSKAYGMAGARIGYTIGQADVIAAFNKIRNQYGISRVGQIGALAALGDQDWLKDVCSRTAQGRERLYQIAADNGLKAIPSNTNFVTMDCGRDPVFAKSVLDGLVGQGIFVRMPFAAPGNRCIRVGVGTEADLDLFAQVLPRVLRTVGK